MNRGIVIAIVALVLLALLGAGIGGYTLWRTSRPLHEVRIHVDRAGTAHENEVMVLEPIEHAAAQTNGMKRITGMATPTGIDVSVFFPGADRATEERTLEHLRAYLKSTERGLPAGLTPPVVVPVLPTDRYFVRAREAASLATLAGVASVETCGKPMPERAVVRLDLKKLAAYGIDLAEVKTALDPRHPFTRGPAVDATELGMLLLRGTPTPVALRDVATITTAARRADCDVFSLDGQPTVYQLVDVVKEHEAPFLQQAKVLGVNVLKEAEALRIRLLFPEQVGRAERVRQMLALLPALREVDGLTLHGAVLRARDGEVVFLVAKTAKPTSIDALRATVAKVPGIAWGGARGPLAKNVHRLMVVVKDGLVGDFDALESASADAAAKVEKEPGVGSAIVLPPGSLVEQRLTPAPGKLTPEDSGWLEKLLVEDETSAIAIVAPDVFAEGRIHGKPVAALATLQAKRERAWIRHDDLERAIELVWETTDASLAKRVRKTFAGDRNVAVTLD